MTAAARGTRGCGRIARAVVLLLGMSATSVQAELLYGEWLRLGSADAAAADRLLNVAGDALQWANAVLRIEGKPALYCAPPGTQIGLEDYRRLLESSVSALGDANAGSVDIPILLLRGLRAAYPCAPAGEAA